MVPRPIGRAAAARDEAVNHGATGERGNNQTHRAFALAFTDPVVADSELALAERLLADLDLRTAPTGSDVSTQGRSMTAESTNRGQEAGSPIGVMPPYSIPLSPTAVSIGANEALRAPSWRRTTPFTSTRVVERTRHAAKADSPPRLPATTTQFADCWSSSRP